MSFEIKKKATPGTNPALYREKCREARVFLNQAINSPNYKTLLMKAVDSYSEATAIHPEGTEPYLALASICWQFGKPVEARGILYQLLEFEPENRRGLRMLKAIEKQLNDTNTAPPVPDKNLKKANQFSFDITKKTGR